MFGWSKERTRYVAGWQALDSEGNEYALAPGRLRIRVHHGGGFWAVSCPEAGVRSMSTGVSWNGDVREAQRLALHIVEGALVESLQRVREMIGHSEDGKEGEG